uniref:Stress protein DDR48-like isoform X2 n=1 Tax=Crassostrea virginica TaxID=6565 RepID=A0A8B8D2P7_CRAVI|nr:stress protein DDR48-like isoform X2 [Crassostrea virginica]
MESLKESYFFAQYKKEFGDKSVTEPSRRRYISRPGSADLPYSSYALSNHDYSGPSYNGYSSSLDPHTYEIMSKYTRGYDYPQSSATRSYSTGSSSGSQTLGSSYGTSSGGYQSSGYQSSQRPQRHASYGSSYEIGTKYGGSSEIGTKYGGSSEIGTKYGGSSEIGTKYGGSSEIGTKYGSSSETGTKYGSSLDIGTRQGGYLESETRYGSSADTGSRYGGVSEFGSRYGGGSTDYGSKYSGSTDPESRYGGSSELGTKYGNSSESRTKYGGGSEFGTSYGSSSSDRSKYGEGHIYDSATKGQGSELKSKYSNRYGETEDSKSTGTSRKVRAPYERYKPLADDDPPRSQDVDIQEIRSRSSRYRGSRDNQKEKTPDTTHIKGSYEIYQLKKRLTRQTAQNWRGRCFLLWMIQWIRLKVLLSVKSGREEILRILGADWIKLETVWRNQVSDHWRRTVSKISLLPNHLTYHHGNRENWKENRERKEKQTM